MFSDRIYREKSNRKDLISFTVTVKETDLHIQAASDLSTIARQATLRNRGYVETYIAQNPLFQTSLKPIPCHPFAPPIVREMIDASTLAGVGPMAAVAGAVSQSVGESLLDYSEEVFVENGGDIFFKTKTDITFAVFAGQSPLSMKIGAKVVSNEMGMGLCTSSGTIGHSKSFGKADAVTVISPSCALADAAATALANRVVHESDIDQAISKGRKIKGIEGIIIVKGDKLGAWGALELVRLSGG